MKKITVPKIVLLASTPIATAFSTIVFSSCACNTKTVWTNDSNFNADCNGTATFELNFSQQPVDNQASIKVTTNSGPTIEKTGSSTTFDVNPIVSVQDQKATVTVEFADKQTQPAISNFNLEVSFKDKNNNDVVTTIPNMQIVIFADPTQKTDEAHILNINDFHGTAPGFGDEAFPTSNTEPGILRLAKEVNKTIEQYPGSVFLSAGDENSGTAFSGVAHGLTIYPLLSAANCQYAAVGNHAFEWGLEYASDKIYDILARTPTTCGNYFVCSNILDTPSYKEKEDWVYQPTSPEFQQDYSIWKEHTVRWADPFKVLNLRGHKVCLIGLQTRKAEVDGNAEATKQLSFMPYKPAIYYAKQLCHDTIGEANFNKIESFILLTHVESGYPEGGEATGDAADIAKNIDTDINVVISAHSHDTGRYEFYNQNLQHHVWVGQAGSKGKSFLDTTLKFDNTKPIGEQLIDDQVTVDTRKVNIDYGGYKESTPEAKEAAKAEYKDLLDNPTGSFNKNVSDVFKKESEIANSELNYELAISTETETYVKDDEWEVLGHQYLDFANVVEMMGAWVERANLYGFAGLLSNDEVPKPWLSFVNQDSVCANWKKGNTIKKLNLYQVDTHDNTVYLGYLTIGQLVNILNYSLCGKTKFDYETLPFYPGKLNTDLNDNQCSLHNIESKGEGADPERQSAYLCGPLQSYGVRFELEKVTRSEELDATYQIKTSTKLCEANGEINSYNCPSIWLYDPTNPLCDLERPETWISAENYLSKEIQNGEVTYVPIIINNFLYDGGNKQFRMFKEYFDYNEAQNAKCKVQHFSKITRDLLLYYCEHWKELVPNKKDFDLNKKEFDKMVILPQNN